jgi:hypothetical protein
MRIIIEVTMLITSLFALKSTNLGLVIYIGYSLISIFSSLFQQNTILRKDYFCCKSLTFFIIFKSILFLSGLINILMISFHFKNQMILFVSFHFFCATILYISYYKFGLKIYRYKLPRSFIMIFVSFYMAFSISMVGDEIERKYSPSNTSNCFVYLGIVSLAL